MLESRILPGVGHLPERDWSLACPGEAEGWAYYRACEASPPDAVNVAAAAVFDAQGLVAAVPLFRLAYRLDTPLQGGLRRLTDALAARAPNLLEWGLLGVGSPFADRCHVALRPGLSDAQRAAALRALVDAIDAEAKRLNISLIAWKDVAARDADALSETLRASGYGLIDGLPVASLRIEANDIDGYLASLSAATRKDVRRKLKGAMKLRVERRTRIGDIAGEIDALYQETRAASALRYGDFEELPRDYFAAVSDALGDDALFMLYRLDNQLIGFNLLLLEPTRVIDKFFGMRPVGRENNLYVASWIENVRFCIETGRRTLQSGQTAYDWKVRLGSFLTPSLNFVKHRNRLINGAIGWAAPYAAFPRWDPDLRRLKAAGRIA